MTTTTNYGLKKPSYTDPADVNDLNYNSDTIDSALHSLDTDKEALVNKSQDVATDAASTDKYPSTKAVADYVAAQIEDKIDEPSSAGTEGQVLTLDSNLDPVWANSSGSLPAGTNNGDILVWDATEQEWVSKPRWQAFLQRVEYIESTGTQYFLLPVDSADGYEITCAMTNFSDGTGAFGYRTSDQQTRFGVFYYQGLYVWQNSNVNTQIENAAINTIYNVKAGAKFENKIIVNDSEIAANSSMTAPSMVGVCGVSSGSIVEGKSATKIYGLDVYQGNTLLASLIPCYSLINGDVGMYDTVNHKFYTNAGTGTFLKGADV